ncbi:BLUF domain-containing protein [Salegentibacter sp. HM20]
MPYYISYVSRQAYNLSDKDLQTLLTRSRIRNEKAGITGMLILYEGLFIQYFEGEQKLVRRLFEKILKDPRHESVFELDSGEQPQRLFSDWSMAFDILESNKAEEILGYKVLHKDQVFLTDENKNNPALELLQAYVNQL